MTEGREVELQALMVEFEALKVEATGQEMADRMEMADFVVSMASQTRKKYRDIADRMREVASKIRGL